MHLLQTSSATLDDIVEPHDLGQTPGDIAILSFADSDLAGLAAAFAAEKSSLPTLRLAHLRELRHPMSIDLWIDKVARHAKVIVVRLLGGLDWWRYGADALSTMARERNIALALLPGEDRDDQRLAASSTLPAEELAVLLQFFREGGRENLRALLRRLARHAGFGIDGATAKPVPRVGGYVPGEGVVTLDALAERLVPGRAIVPIVFYRAAVLAALGGHVDVARAGRGGQRPGPGRRAVHRHDHRVRALLDLDHRVELSPEPGQRAPAVGGERLRPRGDDARLHQRAGRSGAA